MFTFGKVIEVLHLVVVVEVAAETVSGKSDFNVWKAFNQLVLALNDTIGTQYSLPIGSASRKLYPIP